MKAWHLIRSDWTTGEGRLPVVAGETLRVEPPLVLCERGLHASVDPLDALGYAPGPVVCRVEVGGEIVRADDKIVASERTVLWAYDATDVLRRFARLCALDVIDFWDAPPVVVRYLRTGDESIRDAARDARYAAWAAAGAAARDAAWAAVNAAAWAAAWDAARYAMDAAGDAAVDAAKAAQSRRLARMIREGRPR